MPAQKSAKPPKSAPGTAAKAGSKTAAKAPAKAAPAKKSPAPATRKPAPAAAAKGASKAPQKASHTNSVTPPKSVKASSPPAETVKPAAKTPPVAARAAASSTPVKTVPAPAVAKSSVSPAPKVPIPARNLAARAAESDNSDSDDNDPELSTNLLAGPRNVKPYIPRRGEQYMNKEQLDHFRNILETWKRDLMQEVDRTVLHMKDEAANFPDPNDRATQESEFSLELRTRDRERKLIRKIEEAIKRIDDGSYGYCNETGEEIGIKRLEARPVATLSLEAQERRERREKQYGDRDDRYR